MRRSGFQVMLQMIHFVKPLTGYMILAVLMGLIGHVCATFITVLGGYGILQVLDPDGAGRLGVLFGAVLIMALARGFLRYAEQACNHFIAFKLLALIRDKVFGALRRLCPAKLEGRDKGNLIQMITADIELLEVFYAHTISPICTALVFGGGMAFFIGSHHVALGVLAAVAYVFVGGVIPMVISRASGDYGLKLRNDFGFLAGFVLDSLRGLSEILQYGQGETRLEQMNQMSLELTEREAGMKNIAGVGQALTGASILLFDLAMLLLASRFSDFSGTLICTLALMSSFGPFVSLAALGSTLQNTFAAGNRVLDILEEEPVAEEITGQETIRFESASARNISFTYDEELILDDFSMELPANRMIGITGRSGSGKSTLLKLLMRFWKTQKGDLTISGKSVEEINTVNLRDMESYVTQETHLFHDSIGNNLRIAKLDASEEEMVAACQKASIHDFIMGLPKGYDTQVGELGDTLSGGERQRLGLARAFLHDADLMLLDEPTSNLDSLNEAIILKSLHKERGNKTVVLVSHRTSTMGIADEVYSVENGRVS